MYRLYLPEPWKTRIEAWLQMGFANGVPTHPTTKAREGKGGWTVAVGANVDCHVTLHMAPGNVTVVR